MQARNMIPSACPLFAGSFRNFDFCPSAVASTTRPRAHSAAPAEVEKQNATPLMRGAEAAASAALRRVLTKGAGCLAVAPAASSGPSACCSAAGVPLMSQTGIAVTHTHKPCPPKGEGALIQ